MSEKYVILTGNYMIPSKKVFNKSSDAVKYLLDILKESKREAQAQKRALYSNVRDKEKELKDHKIKKGSSKIASKLYNELTQLKRKLKDAEHAVAELCYTEKPGNAIEGNGYMFTISDKLENYKEVFGID